MMGVARDWGRRLTPSCGRAGWPSGGASPTSRGSAATPSVCRSPTIRWMWPCCRRRSTTRKSRHAPWPRRCGVTAPGGRVLVLDLRTHKEEWVRSVG